MTDLVVMGLGYVGLPTAVLFAFKGLKVVGVDIDRVKVKAINNGNCYIKEPGLEDLLRDVVARGLLRATTNGLRAIREANAVIVAVPTPVREGKTDLSYLKNALEIIKKGFHKDILVIIESTIPPGTTEGFVKPFLEESGFSVENDFYLAHVPERIAPGNAIKELCSIPRVVGGIGPRSTKKAIELYSKINPNLLPTDATTAELVKLAENTFRDLNIAYANLLALISEKVGVDVYEVIELANTHPRVNIHWPGTGVGGPCLTKDPYMLVEAIEDLKGKELILIAREINKFMPHHTVKLIVKALKDNAISIESAQVAILGTAYKGGVNDVRESPAKFIVKELLVKGATVVVYDPYTEESFGAKRAASIEEAVKNADVLVIVTDHPEFKKLNLKKIARLMKNRIIVDGRRIIEPSSAVKNGFKYYGIGFGKVK